MSFRCSASARDRGDLLAGTASTVRAVLTLEHQGPWGAEALRDARLPEGVGSRIAAAARESRVRPLLIRRGREREERDTISAFLARDGRLTGGALTAADDAVAVLHGAPLDPVAGPLFLVCTHGKHDACCAERGRPVAAALLAERDDAWECSHIGGDRFAANLLVLPDLLYYGGLEPSSALAVAESHVAGHLDLEHLRGRSSLPMPAQAAEIALRRDLGETRLDAVVVRTVARDDDITRVHADVDGTAWTVTVRTRLDDPARLTCGVERLSPVPRHEIVAITR